MAMPKLTEETALAVLDKMTKDSPDPCSWTLKYAESFIEEQPALFYSITENIKQLYPDVEDNIANASKSLYLAMITYNLIKAAVEVQELKDMFGEENEIK
jgi:hypothetical protein